MNSYLSCSPSQSSSKSSSVSSMAATSYLLSASPHLRVTSNTSSSIRRHKISSQQNVKFGGLRVIPCLVFENIRQRSFSCAANMAAGHSDDPERISLHYLTDKARKLWDSAPQPVKDFPWNRALDSFIQLMLDLILATIKILSVPLLAISSLSEMSYCARQKKLTLVPIPLLIGVVVAGILNDAALQLSPLLKEAQVPWHLITIAIFFTLLKLVGPYFPYWGRLFIPHLANGALVRTIWSLVWHNNQQPRKIFQQDETKNSSSA